MYCMGEFYGSDLFFAAGVMDTLKASLPSSGSVITRRTLFRKVGQDTWLYWRGDRWSVKYIIDSEEQISRKFTNITDAQAFLEMI